MVNAQDLGEKIIQSFNFMYEVNEDYYVLGRDYFRPCTDLEISVFKGFKQALEEDSEEGIIEQYRRVRRYVSDSQPSSKGRNQEIVDFIQKLSERELESLGRQVERAMKYAQIAYR